MAVTKARSQSRQGKGQELSKTLKERGFIFGVVRQLDCPFGLGLLAPPNILNEQPISCS